MDINEAIYILNTFLKRRNSPYQPCIDNDLYDAIDICLIFAKKYKELLDKEKEEL